MINSDNAKEREEAVHIIHSTITLLENIDQAWKDLLALTKDQNSYVRWRAVEALSSEFQHLTDKDQAWKDLLVLTKDEDGYVKWCAANALGSAFQNLPDKEQAWKDLLAFAKDEHSGVRRRALVTLGSAFPHLPDKEQAWKDLLALINDQDSHVQRIAVDALGSALQFLMDKEQASKDLLALTKDQDSYVQRIAVGALGSAFQYLADKEQASKDLLTFTEDQDIGVRSRAAGALGFAFRHLTDKEEASKDLLALTNDQDSHVQRIAVGALGFAFRYLTDKEQASKDLLALTKDKNSGVRSRATGALGSAFRYLTDKEMASKDLLALTKDQNSKVRSRAAGALGIAFRHLTDKEQASKDLLALTKDQDSKVRKRAVGALGSAFRYLTDKEVASKDLLALTTEQDSKERTRAAYALGSAFQYLTDKEQAWKDMFALTKDEHSNVRVSANHSLGKISVYRATNADNEDLLQKELENAIDFFEKSAQESTWFNPAKFCLPFYRSYYSVIFRKQEAEEVVKKNLDEAKRVVFGSESRKMLLEAVENLSNALNEAQKLRDLDDIKTDLNGYRRYCDRACELLDSAEDRAPEATLLVRKGLPVIDERIQDTIKDIQKKSKALCKKTRNAESPLEPLGIEINQYASELSTKDNLKSERTIPRITRVLGNYCKHLPEEKRGYACELIDEINNEEELSDKLNKIELVLTYLEPQIEIEMKSSNKEFNAKQLKPTNGIITALPKEFAAMKILLENTTSFKVPGQGAGRKYFLGKIPSNDGEYHSVVLALADMGNNIAALRASLLLEHFPNVTSIIMTGIAGGVPYPEEVDEHVRLGDIVVSDHRGIIQYDFVSDKIEEKVHRFPPRPPSASLLEAVRLLQAFEIEGNRPWLKYIDQGVDKLNFHRPPTSKDILFSSENDNEVIPHKHDKKRTKGQPRVFYGPIASANRLLKNPIKRDELREKFKIKAVEMESSGIADATWNREIGYLAIRGICDYCDSKKGDDWQDYAAIIAAAYTRALIESI